MTQAKHLSGTDRIAEVAMQQGWSDDSIVLNVQGDEPLISPILIAEVANQLNNDQSAAMATACYAISNETDFINRNVVKLVLDDSGHAINFSRAPIPSSSTLSAYRHVGIYAYRVKFLKLFTSLPQSALEKTEALEQLRALHYGYKITVYVSSQAPVTGVDTMDDLVAVRARFQSHQS
jgi:3-deoxy-manno-octulosonate cytidylyltransferase (CMP-KDO synthetase)